MGYTLVTANRNYSSWSLRPWVLMQALAIPFEDRIEPFAEGSNFEAYRSFSPTGQVPALIDGDRTVWDTLGITLYLADRHPGVWPQDAEARAFAQSAVAEMHSGFRTLRNACPMSVGVRVALASMPEALEKDIARVRDIFETGLDRFCGPWLGGAAFTALDAFFAPVAFRIRTYGLDVGRGQVWGDAVLAHAAMRTWEAAALAEPWREPGHEAEVGATGTITADHRSKG